MGEHYMYSCKKRFFQYGALLLISLVSLTACNPSDMGKTFVTDIWVSFPEGTDLESVVVGNKLNCYVETNKESSYSSYSNVKFNGYEIVEEVNTANATFSYKTKDYDPRSLIIDATQEGDVVFSVRHVDTTIISPVYEIHYRPKLQNVTNLDELKEALNKSDPYLTISMENDIDCTGMVSPISANNYGILEGNNHSLKNFAYEVLNDTSGHGLVGNNYGVIRNLNIEDTDILVTSATTKVAAVAGANRLGALIENVDVSGDIIMASSTTYVGAIAGSNYGTIKDCVNNVARIEGSIMVGGIAGENYSSKSGETPEILSCVNNGDILIYTSKGGGITGASWTQKDGVQNIHNCENNGDINQINTCTLGRIGGIAGLAFKTNIMYSKPYTMPATVSIRGYEYVGGFVGDGDLDGPLQNVTNAANVASFGYHSSDNGNVSQTGGIGGWLTAESISNCSNTGHISSNYGQIGGIAGASRNTTITRCTNTGEISCETQFSGGIVGFLYSTLSNKLNVYECSNSGTIHATDKAGGILGAGQGNGSNDKAIVLVKCTNSGTIDCTGTYKGDLVGAVRYVLIDNRT